MDKKRIIGIVSVAFVLALAAGIGAYRFLSEKGRVAEAAKLQSMGIAVAVVDIPLGSTINPNQVALSPWPKELHPKDAFPALKPVIGRVSARRLEYLTASFRQAGLNRSDARHRARLAYAAYVGFLQLNLQLQQSKLPHDEFEAYVEHVMSTLIPPIPPTAAA